MPNELSSLAVNEVSLVDAPACSEVDPKTQRKIQRAVVAIWKRHSKDSGGADVNEQELRALCKADDAWDDNDLICKAVGGGGAEGVCKDGVCQTQGGSCFPASDWAFTPDKTKPSTWKLRLTSSPGGKPDAKIVGAAVAALGKGFRGNKVQIPSDKLASVKSRVRAAWRAANPDKGDDELPPILKSDKGDTMPTLEAIEKNQIELEGTIATLKAATEALLAENTVSKAISGLVLKMSKKERKAFGAMTDDQKKAYMAADEEKRKGMMKEACNKRDEEKLVVTMSAADQQAFAKAGPSEKLVLLAKAEKAAKLKKSGSDKPDKPGADDEPDEDDKDEEEMKRKAQKRDAEEAARIAKNEDRLAKAEAELSAIRKQERIVKFSKVAEAELPHTPGSPEEKGIRLMKMADAFGEQSKDYTELLDAMKSADKALAGEFGEVGKSGQGNGVIPMERVFNAEVEKIAKRDNCDVGKATFTLMKENPQLFAEYDHQYAQRVGTRQ